MSKEGGDRELTKRYIIHKPASCGVARANMSRHVKLRSVRKKASWDFRQGVPFNEAGSCIGEHISHVPRSES